MKRDVEDTLRQRLERWSRFDDEAVPGLAGQAKVEERTIGDGDYRIVLSCARVGNNLYEMSCQALLTGGRGKPQELVYRRSVLPRRASPLMAPPDLEERLLKRAEVFSRDDGEARVRQYLAGCHGAWPTARNIAERLAMAYAWEGNVEKAFHLLAEAGRFPRERYDFFERLCKQLRRRKPERSLVCCGLLQHRCANRLSLDESRTIRAIVKEQHERIRERELPVRRATFSALLTAFVTFLARREGDIAVSWVAAAVTAFLIGYIVYKSYKLLRV